MGMNKKAVFLVLVIVLITGCDYGRFKDQQALRAYKAEMPQMVEGTIPVRDSIQVLRMTKPDDLHNPLPLTRGSVDMGRERYGYYCIMCHGPKADGDGTVGQSFSPLPPNLASPYVQKQSDGELFYKIYFGFRRHPELIYTVAGNDRWLIINYIRSLAKNP
jgi:mono/diheme cytochrome c family protein